MAPYLSVIETGEREARPVGWYILFHLATETRLAKHVADPCKEAGPLAWLIRQDLRRGLESTLGCGRQPIRRSDVNPDESIRLALAMHK